MRWDKNAVFIIWQFHLESLAEYVGSDDLWVPSLHSLFPLARSQKLCPTVVFFTIKYVYLSGAWKNAPV